MAPARRDGADCGRRPPGAPPPPGRVGSYGLVIANVLGTGVLLNGDGLRLQVDSALGLVAVDAATHGHFNFKFQGEGGKFQVDVTSSLNL